MKSPLQPGMTLQGRYKIIDIIGSGGMGTVFKARALRLNKDCAIKEMQDYFLDPEDKKKIIAQFQNEAKTLAKLDHPGIPHILDTFDELDKYYLVMEFVDGSTLEELKVINTEQFSQPQVLGWLEQIMEILNYLHTLPQPVIVRDLKPANIMLTDDGKIKIIDFGIAKIFEQKNSQTMTRIKGSGSAGFAPPEQYGSKGTDARSDIYSLGVTLYYLLTGITLPDSVDRILNNVPPESIPSINPTVSPKLEEIILKMIRLKPEDRFQSVPELQKTLLENGLKGENIPVKVKKLKVEDDEYKDFNGFLPEKEEPVEVQAKKAASVPTVAYKLTAEDLGLSYEKTSRIKQEFSGSKPEPIKVSDLDYKNSNEDEEIGNPTKPLPAYANKPEPVILKKGNTNEAKKNSSTTIIMVLCAIILLIIAGVIVHIYIQQNKKPEPVIATPTPTPTVTEEIEKTPPYIEKNVKGEVITIEIGKTRATMRVKTADRYISLIIDRDKIPKNLKASAQIEATYKIPKQTPPAQPPWGVIKMVVTKESTAKVKPVPVYTPKPAYTPPVKAYTQPRTYAPRKTYTPPVSKPAAPAPAAPAPPPKPAAPSGGFTQERPAF